MTARARLMLELLTLAIATTLSIPASAQTAIVSADGDGVFRAPGASSPGLTSMLTFKSDDTSVKLSFATPMKSGTAGQTTYGADISVKSSQGLGAVVKSGTYAPGTKINGYLLRHSLLTDVKSGSSVDWIVVQGTLTIAQQPLFDATKPYADQLTKPVFKGLSLKGTYAYEHSGWLLLGGMGGIERTSNYGDLKDVVVSNQSTYADVTSGAVRAVNTDETTAKQGTYAEGNIGLVRLDMLLYPSNWASGRVGVTVYQSNRLSGDKLLRRSDIGVGLALLKKDSPTMSLGAVVVELKDIANEKGSTQSLGRRIALSLQGSIPISPKLGF